MNSASGRAALRLELTYEDELDDNFTGLAGPDGMMTIAGFGSLLSERSARYTFPDPVNFRTGLVYGWRRVFAHTADVFFGRGIARPDTGEIASLSLERCSSTPLPAADQPANDGAGADGCGTATPATAPPAPSPSPLPPPPPPPPVVVSLFEVPYSPAAVAAFIAREHEFRFVAVEPADPAGLPTGRRAVICARNTDADYRALRCPPAEWEARWGRFGLASVWGSGATGSPGLPLLPCRAYLRHCVLAARGLGREAEESFLRHTYLADRTTTVAEYLSRHPDIMDERPPPELAQRYNG